LFVLFLFFLFPWVADGQRGKPNAVPIKKESANRQSLFGDLSEQLSSVAAGCMKYIIMYIN